MRFVRLLFTFFLCKVTEFLSIQNQISNNESNVNLYSYFVIYSKFFTLVVSIECNYYFLIIFKHTKKCTFSLFYKKNMYDRIHILENEEIFWKFLEYYLNFSILIMKNFQKVILIFKLELKYALKFIAYTNKKCNGKSW